MGARVRLPGTRAGGRNPSGGEGRAAQVAFLRYKETGMKRWECLACAAMVLAASCGGGGQKAVWENSAPEEKWEILREHYMAPGADASDERPLPNVLSEREILLKAADAAVKEGVLDSSYYAYQNNPALMTAKIETPILLTDAVTGVPDGYLLTAIDEDGISLACVFVDAGSDVSEESFAHGRSISEPGGAYNHIITKREAAELIQSQFPGAAVSEPMMISNLWLGDDPHSHIALFWYFTVGADEEYVITPYPRGDHFLQGCRMAKLNRSLRLFDKINAARVAGGISFSASASSVETVGFTPVMLK